MLGVLCISGCVTKLAQARWNASLRARFVVRATEEARAERRAPPACRSSHPVLSRNRISRENHTHDEACLSGCLTNQSEVMLRKRTSWAWIYCEGMNWQRRARRAVAQAALPAVSQRLRLAPRAGRLEARGTADWKSALRSLREPPAIGSSLAAEFRRGRRRRTERSRSIPCEQSQCPGVTFPCHGFLHSASACHLAAPTLRSG